ncbi:reverse transcriptase/maturase family protein [Aliarcobacter cryaerophilus]|uniref:reverse transcriptase/maturase family protein n=1 Tax=Aliarcobacter cryaerophilus TaxID=28198 RepID=UPI0021B48C63|nr:reverse transcriptase/maturase family protein [Aliarcobacter cryaerophilus]MCT7433704.1 reverse transcriptase/maturase family protein [Aliarcobacter cryaerophilus]MCT7521132.1 reverse transcriptase/maturase family protein [Aliarcobacter cryaerophilus]
MYILLNEIYSSFSEVQAVGIDGTSKEKFDEILDSELSLIQRKIENNIYDFSFYKQKLIVKSMNKTREISIPTLRDKLVIKYLDFYIRDKFEEVTKNILNAQQIIKKVKDSKNKYDSFIKVDIQNFFSSINHEILVNKLKSNIDDETILNLITKVITQSTVDVNTPFKQRIKYNNKEGLPQGLSISGLLSEIYLFDLVQKYSIKDNLEFFRYVDDVLIFCKKSDIEEITKSLKSDFEDLKLTIHDFAINSNKSSFGNINEPFEFLGYKFEDKLISVRETSIQKMYANISKLFTLYKNKKYFSKEEFITRLNLKITGCVIDGKKYGWISFFSLINDYTLLFMLDKFVEKSCKNFNINYEEIKKFSRAIYEIKDPNTNYLTYDLSTLKTSKTKLVYDFYDDIDFY